MGGVCFGRLSCIKIIVSEPLFNPMDFSGYVCWYRPRLCLSWLCRLFEEFIHWYHFDSYSYWFDNYDVSSSSTGKI